VSDVRSSDIEIDGAKVRLHRGGRGEPLVYLHGEDGGPPALELAGMLAEGLDVWVPEHPGFGASATPPWLETIHDLAYFYLDFLDALRLPSVHLAGHSLGGWIALEIAVRNPGLVKSLTLIGSAGIHVNGVPKGDFFMRPPEVVFHSLFADESIAAAVLARPTPPEAEDIRIKNRYAIARVAWHPPFFNPQLAKWLHRITGPVHIVWGDTDRMFPIAYAHEFRRLLPHARLTVLPRCGHMPHLERPRELAASIATGLAGRPQ
jgi:pimeloyl-ACP methyl ester carboxylesterase